MKTYYSDFVQHCLRHYTRHTDQTDFRTKVEYANWKSCRDVLESLNDAEKDLVLRIYRSTTPVNKTIDEISEMEMIPVSILWKLASNTELSIAKKRGLL